MVRLLSSTGQDDGKCRPAYCPAARARPVVVGVLHTHIRVCTSAEERSAALISVYLDRVLPVLPRLAGWAVR